MTSSHSFRDRLAARFKYGLVTQEILDRLARCGVCFYPYVLVRELPMDRAEFAELGDRFDSRFLRPVELVEVSQMPQRPLDLARLERRLQHGKCFGVFVSGQLVAYSWYSSDKIPVVVGGQALCPLPKNALYLYDTYVRPEFRGQRIAGFMRHQMHQSLATQGASSFIGASLAFNKSSRRFNLKLGAQEFEMRLLFTIAKLGGVDMRLSQREKFAETPRFMRLPHAAGQNR